MAQNKNFIAARLPQELYDHLDSVAGTKKGEKTRIIAEAIAAYLNFPLKSSDTAVDNNEKFVALENRIAELEQQFQEFKLSVISHNVADNNTKKSVIATDFVDNSIKSSVSVNHKRGNKNTIVIQNDGSISPASESQIADFMKISRRSLSYHRQTLKEKGKPLNQPKRVKYNNKSYNLICLGEAKDRGKTIFLWTANLVIEPDNKLYQPDITKYQVDNNLLDTLQEPNQEKQKQDLESPGLSDNRSYQELSLQTNTKQKAEQNLQSLQVIDNSSYQQLSVEPDTSQEENKQNLQNLEFLDNTSYQELSIQPDFNKELNEEIQDSSEQSTTEHQPELPGAEQPEF